MSANPPLLSETISIVRNFTFQKTIHKTFGRKETSMIPCKELKSLVINEVFDNVRNGLERRWKVTNPPYSFSNESSS